jgi:nucleoside-diphosphate-sugar epimerase
MFMEKTIVVGGSGFIGKAVQKEVITQDAQNAFVFSYSKNPQEIGADLEKIQVNLLGRQNLEKIRKYSSAIYVAGSAEHGLARASPSLDLDLNVKAFLSFMKVFRGSLVLLSSQAVYYGLEGEIKENVDHVPTMPYGLSKLMTEAYAKYFLETTTLSSLWIFRLMYAFGEGEKARRLIPRCANAAINRGEVNINGEGKSFLNPLPSWFVGKILVKGMQSLLCRSGASLGVTNLNHSERFTVGDVVKFLASVRNFKYIINAGGEEWSVRFWGNTGSLLTYMEEWKIDFPDIRRSLKKHFIELLGEQRK